MNQVYSALFTNPLIIIMIVLSILIIITYIFFYPKIIGWFGEHWTKKALSKLPKDKYKIINDVLIHVDGVTHQIDHIIVSPYGIFSIETKQYNGNIYGDKYSEKWIKYVGKKKIFYTNPIKQNYGHVISLSKLLNIDVSKIYNVVCIPSTAKLKIKNDGELTRYDTILDKILSYKEVVIDNMDEIVNKINQSNITDKNIRKEHNINIQNKIESKDPNICPKCGGHLIKRKGKYGYFIGCSNYPKCDYTKNIE